MRKVLTANEGYIYTNGESYGTIIYLAEDIAPETYYQITLEEYNELNKGVEESVLFE